ncbi:F0F1 ATP synthase subunit B [Candidatus Bipolaricaulota bacterium]|nr:F0F1 ATP synthase subunit B [Candidatus Bipolaricaulota bacterium]
MRLEWGTIVKNINWTLILNLVNFALLLWLLKRLLWRPVLAWLDRRRQLEEERLLRAKDAQAQAEALLRRREEELSQANRQAREILARAEAEAQRLLREARREARDQAQRIIAEGEAAAGRAREEALAELRRAYAELVLLGASRVLEREVRPADHERLLAELTGRIDPRLLQ